MPRAGLTTEDVVTAAAEMADEIGYRELTMGHLAQRLGVRTPSLYKHVDDLSDVRHRVATRAITELGDAIREALQGRSGLDALTALLTATRSYVAAHPGRYAATIGAEFTGPADPLLVAGTRVIDSIAAVLRGYGIRDSEMDHAIRTLRCTIHGFAVLQAEGGFQWSGDPDDTFAWMTGFIDSGLRGAHSRADDTGA
ncbi:MAG: TetR/AcrR family transcriptional regulator [Streptosporangiaceae bacterium]